MYVCSDTKKDLDESREIGERYFDWTLLNECINRLYENRTDTKMYYYLWWLTGRGDLDPIG